MLGVNSTADYQHLSKKFIVNYFSLNSADNLRKILQNIISHLKNDYYRIER